MDETYDVVVVGGGPAGISAATALARSRRAVLVIDAGQPRNAPAAHVHNYLGREGTPPHDLLAAGRDEMTAYGGHLLTGSVTDVRRHDGDFLVTVDDDHQVRARRLLLATGLVDELPDVPGVAQRWGQDVLHCPYCHGWEVRDQRIGILGSGPPTLHQAQLWRQLSDHVTYLLHQSPPLTRDDAHQLAARRIPVVEEPVAELVITDDELAGVRLATGEVIDIDVLVVSPRFSPRIDFAASLELPVVDVEVAGHVTGRQIDTDPHGATGVPGLWAAGNVADSTATVISAAATGLKAAAMINADLAAAETREAVEAYRRQMRTMLTEEAWEERYRSSEAVWSGQPNPQLVAEVETLTPGRALDAGTGEGADAIWLAQRRWRVTAVDISRTALERAASNAARAGTHIADRITWRHVDLLDSSPEERAYDLVSAQFIQLPYESRRDLFARLAAAVAPGGTLLIVGHHPRMLRTGSHRMHVPDMMYPAEEVASLLDPAEWQDITAETRERTVRNADGGEKTLHDAVLVARRRH